MRKVEQIQKICKICGNSFEVQPSYVRASAKKGHEVNYCSRDCFWVAHNKLRKKLGGFAKGKTWTHTEDYKKRLSFARTGDKNPMWINGSNKRRRRGKVYPEKKWREKIFKRDDYTCQECDKRGGDLNAHHIRFWSKHPKERFKLYKGVTLCVSCHKDVHRFERMWERTLNEDKIR